MIPWLLMKSCNFNSQAFQFPNCNLLFHFQTKQHWLGPNFARDGPAGNDINRSNVPDIRVAFRYETLLEELFTVFQAVSCQTVEELSCSAIQTETTVATDTTSQTAWHNFSPNLTVVVMCCHIGLFNAECLHASSKCYCTVLPVVLTMIFAIIWYCNCCSYYFRMISSD